MAQKRNDSISPLLFSLLDLLATARSHLKLTTMVASIVPQTRCLLSLPADLRITRETSELSEGDIVWERLKNDLEREYSKRSQQQRRNSDEQTITRQTVTLQITSSTLNQFGQSPHVEFLKRLFANHPNQSDPKRRPRMTALNMWDMFDEQNLQAEETAMAEMSEISSPPESVNVLDYATPKHEPKSKRENNWTDMDVEVDDDNSTQKSNQSGFMVDRNGDPEHGENEKEQEEEHSSAKKLSAMEKKIDSIDGLRTMLAAWEDVESPKMAAMASGDLSQEDLNDIF